MIIKRHKITIINIKKPKARNLNKELQWFGNALGLFSMRDKDRSCFRIFIELLKGAKADHAFTSDELAFNLNLSRGTIVHHLNKLMEAGIVVNDRNRYALRVNNLEILMDEIQKDINRTCNDLKQAAKEIDSLLGL